MSLLLTHRCWFFATPSYPAYHADKERGFIHYTVQRADVKQPQPTGIIVF